MTEIREFYVVEPPTSGEFQGRVHAELPKGIMMLGVLAMQDIPRSVEQTITMTIRSTLHPEAGGMDVMGVTESGADVVVRAPSDESAPATASIVGEL
ncbi:MAG: hypothetical protein ACREGB_01295 [Candidatus Saccharimonadales bacterium]